MAINRKMRIVILGDKGVGKTGIKLIFFFIHNLKHIVCRMQPKQLKHFDIWRN